MKVDFKFDSIQLSLHREPPEVGLVEAESLYRWVELGMLSLHWHSLILKPFEVKIVTVCRM